MKPKDPEKSSSNVCQDNINELMNIDTISDIKFNRIAKENGIYVTNSINEDTNNDMRIFRETQIKRTLRSCLSPFISQEIKSKLMYFSQGEDKDENKIYK